MKRLLLIVSVISFSVACAEQPGKKKEEDSKVETRAVDGSKPAPAKTEAKPGEAK